MGLIYIIKNQCNNKVYIGQTTRSLQSRWSQHKKAAQFNREPSMILYNAMRKYGIENFYISILEDNIPTQELNKKEEYWINYFDCITPKGYNVRGGGQDCGRKEVLKIDIKTNQIIECYGSAMAAAEANNIDYSLLTKVCRKEEGRHSCGGFKWIYAEDYDYNYLNKIHTKLNKCAVYQLKPYTKEIINQFESIANAAKQTKTLASSISSVLSGRYKIANNFGWCYVEDYQNYIPSKPITKAVIQLDKNGNFIKEWQDAQTAAKEINKNANSIRAVCRGVGKTAYGYIWKYKEDYINVKSKRNP